MALMNRWRVACLESVLLLPLSLTALYSQQNTGTLNTATPNSSKTSVRIPGNTSTATNYSLSNGTSDAMFRGCAVFAIESAEIPAKDSGVIGDILVRLNQEVDKDQGLAKLESRSIEIERSVAALQSQVAISEAADTTEIQVAEAILEEAKIFLQNYERMKAKGSASETELRQKELAVSQAELKVLNAKQLHEQKKLRAKLAQSTVMATDERLARMSLYAPFQGVVKDVLKGKGEWVQAGQPILRIVRLNEVRVDCYIHFSMLAAHDFVDLPVQVILDSSGASSEDTPGHENILSGRITSIDPEVSSLGTVRMHATVQNQRQGSALSDPQKTGTPNSGTHNSGKQKSGEQWLLRPGMTVSLVVPSLIPKGNLVRERSDASEK